MGIAEKPLGILSIVLTFLSGKEGWKGRGGEDRED